MKLFRKTLLVTALSSLLLSGSLFAQEIDMSQNVTIQGRAGKMIIFKSVPGMTEMILSRNGKFLMGRSRGEEGSEESDNLGIIYEIATGKMEVKNSSIIEVVDWDNYVTSSYARIDGKEYFEFTKAASDSSGLAIEEASADLLTLRASLYLTRRGADFGDILIETKTGKILDTLKELDPTYPDGGKMNMGWAMSNDAKIIAGRASLTDAPVNYSPAFWDRDRGEVYFTGYEYKNDNGDNLFTSGEMWGVNGSGTLLCGDIYERACVMTYDRKTGKYEVSYLDNFPGYDRSQAFKINERGMVIGTEQMGIDIYTRLPFIYDMEKDQKYRLDEYLKDFYGLDGEQVVPLFTPLSISDDSRLISGYSYEGTTWYAYLIVLDEHQAYAPVHNVQVQAVPRRSSNIEVSWQAPLKGEYTLTGYKIFRDREEVGTVPATELSFKEEGVENGRHKYFVKAVYGDKVSDAFDTVSIFVVDPDGCLPIQEMFYDVEYNRTVSLCWGLPSDQEASNIINRPKGHVSKYIPQEGLDFVSVFQPRAARLSVGIRIGDYIYSGSYEAGGIFVYDQFGNTVKEIPIEGVGNIYDMTYHDGSFYVTTGSERVVVLDMNPEDPFDISESNHFTTTFSKAISITYVENDDESVNNGEDYLMVGNYYNLVGYPLDAANPDYEFELPVKFNTDGMIVSGSEYYKGRLYLSDQNGTNGCDLVAYDMTTGKKLFTTDLYAHPIVVDASNNPKGEPDAVYSGGLIHSTLADGTEVLECLVQCQYTYNMIVDMELESSEDVLGYVVYRNNEKISDTLKTRHFTEIIDEPGKYVYHVEYLSVRGCSSSSKNMDVTSTVVIYDKGDCSAPGKLAVYESNKKAVLTWSDQCLDKDGFVGFNLYRNGKQIGEKHFLELRYTDSEVEIGPEYEYSLEAFYNNSCAASDTVKITLNGKGAAREPGGFSVEGTEKDKDTVNVKATWTLPYFEEPMAYGYCGIPASANAIKETPQLFCLIGWDKDDMYKFDEDLYLVGVEFVLGLPSTSDALRALSTVVYVNDELVYNKPYEERFQAKEWVPVYFDQVFKMKQSSEIAVGYSISYDYNALGSNESVFAYDMGPRTKTKSDLMSFDGKAFGTWYAISQSQFDVNLCINALVVRLRDIEAAALAADPQEYLMHKTMRMDLRAQIGQEQKFTDAPKTSSEGIKLLGFNIYRDGEKLNDKVMTDLIYEETVARGEYEYEVGAVYEGSDELKASLYVDFTHVGVEDLEKAYGVSVYPNPATDRLNIKGAYVSFMLVDMNGRVLMRDVRNTESVSLAGLNDGVYFMLITLPNGDKRAVKVIKR